MLHTGFEKSFRFLLLITFFSCFYPEVWPKYFSVCDACMKFLSPHFPFCLRLAGSGSNCLKFMSLCTKLLFPLSELYFTWGKFSVVYADELNGAEMPWLI